MPQLSLGEIVLLVVVAVVFIRPDDWPRVLRAVGRIYGQVHTYLTQANDYSRRTYEQITQLDQEPPPPAPAQPPGRPGDPAAPAAPAAGPKPQDDAKAK